jgi:hypothetical protein
MDQLFRSDNDIIAEIKEKYSYHLSWANKYKAMLDAADGVGLTQKPNNSGVPPIVNKRNDVAPTVSGRKKETFADIIVKYFEDGKPKTTMMLLTLYNQNTNHPLDRKNLSSRLSIMAKLTKQIKNIEFEEASNDTRFWWGLSSWFDDSGLKPDHSKYISLTKKSTKILALD